MINYILKNTTTVLLLALFLFIILFFRQCEQIKQSELKIIKHINNEKALKDTVRNYIDKNGKYAGEIRGLTLSLDEAKKLLDIEKNIEKNKTPLTIIKSNVKIAEKIDEVPVISIDTNINEFSSAVIISSADSWGKSSRNIKTTVPYSIEKSVPKFGNASIDIQQNIFLSAYISRDKKTKEVFVNITTDYPGTTFNSLQGVVIDQKSSGFKDIQYSNRKTIGIGLHTGLGLNSNQIKPYIGIGINYTPKFLQW